MVGITQRNNEGLVPMQNTTTHQIHHKTNEECNLEIQWIGGTSGTLGEV
jgi:hypothetical protein